MTYLTTTEDYWEVDGVPLNTYAFNISTLAGRVSTPPTRGEDQSMAYRPGRAFRPKVADSRTISLSMWVQGTDPGSMGPASDPGKQFRSNLHALMKLFYSPSKQLTITRRWSDLSGTYTTVAKGQVVGSIQPAFQNEAHATFVVDLFLADPFFYGPAVTASSSGNSTFSLTVPGDDFSARKFGVTFSGTATNPKLINHTTGTELTFNRALGAGQDAVIDVGSSRAVTLGRLSNSKVSSTGLLWWMDLDLGVNNFELVSAGGVSLSYQPAYF